MSILSENVRSLQESFTNFQFVESEVVTTLSKDTVFEGYLEYTNPLMIYGKFRGKICTSGCLWIMDTAMIEADIFVGAVRISGTVKGNIFAKDKVELLSNARLFGNIKTKKLKIMDGVFFEGNCDMGDLDSSES